MPAISPPPRTELARYYCWLYTPPAQRNAVAAAFEIERELASSARRGLDHAVSHARLAWWQEELERLKRGEPRHPAAIALEPSRPDLRPLATHAAMQLARESLSADRASVDDAQLAQAWSLGLFVPLAGLLASAPGPQIGLAPLGEALYLYENEAGREGALQDAWREIDPARAPALRGLFVWSALAARTARIPDLLAWRAARRAARGHLTLP